MGLLQNCTNPQQHIWLCLLVLAAAVVIIAGHLWLYKTFGLGQFKREFCWNMKFCILFLHAVHKSRCYYIAVHVAVESFKGKGKWPRLKDKLAGKGINNVHNEIQVATPIWAYKAKLYKNTVLYGSLKLNKPTIETLTIEFWIAPSKSYFSEYILFALLAPQIRLQQWRSINLIWFILVYIKLKLRFSWRPWSFVVGSVVAFDLSDCLHQQPRISWGGIEQKCN